MTKPPPPPLDEKARREARLAQALRANLRKRKSGAVRPEPKTDQGED